MPAADAKSAREAARMIVLGVGLGLVAGMFLLTLGWCLGVEWEARRARAALDDLERMWRAPR